MALNENVNGTPDETGGETEKMVLTEASYEEKNNSPEDGSDKEDILTEDRDALGESCIENERAEYENLIKTRFKDFYAEDVQKLINKRFKKLKALEEKVTVLEENARSLPDMETLLRAEREKAIEETEQRMNRLFASNKSRPGENGVLPRTAAPVSDVSKLTRTQRASLAQRASRGEKIKF